MTNMRRHHSVTLRRQPHKTRMYDIVVLFLQVLKSPHSHLLTMLLTMIPLQEVASGSLAAPTLFLNADTFDMLWPDEGQKVLCSLLVRTTEKVCA